MKQTTRSMVWLLAFIGAALAVGFGAAWVGRDEEKKTEQKEKSAKLFDGLDKSKVRSLRLEKAGKLVALAVRPDEKSPWKLAEPLSADADEGAVNSLLEAAVGLKQKSDLGGESDLKQFGLDAPRTRISFKLDDGKEEGDFGADNQFDNTLYLRKLGEKIIRIGEGSSKAPFEKVFFDLRDKRVAHLDDGAELRRIEVRGGPASYALIKDGKDWKLESPPGTAAGLADASTADRLASSLKSLRASGVQVEDLAPAMFAASGLTPPKFEVKLSVLPVQHGAETAPAGGKDVLTRTLLFAQPRPTGGSVSVKSYAKRDDSQVLFEVDNQILKDLSKDPGELEDKQLLHVNREEVRRIDFDSPGGDHLVIERKKDPLPDGGVGDETFTMVAPKQGPAKKYLLSSALFSLGGLRAGEFGEAPPKDSKGLALLGLAKPRVVTLFGDGGKVLARVQVGSLLGDQKRRWVLVAGAARVAQVEKSSVDDLPWKLDEALEAPPAPPPLPAPHPDGGTPAAHAP